MINKCLSLFFALLLLMPTVVLAEIYSWQHDNGTPAFGDEPISTPSAILTPSATNTFSPPKTSESTPILTNKVTLYTTSWCGFCRKARQYFRENNIKFIEYDIEKNAVAANTKKKLDKKHDGVGVPVAIINDKVIYGFRPAVYKEALNF